MSSGVSARKALSPDAGSPPPDHQFRQSPKSRSPGQTAASQRYIESPESTGPSSTLRDAHQGAFPGVSRNGSLLGSMPSLPQVEALEAADAIDAVLRKRSEPVHERLKDSLTSALRSQAKVTRSFNEIDIDGIAAARGFKTGLSSADALGGPRSFGKQLAASWTSLPDTGLDGGRSRVLEKLDGTQAARVRGLLTHLEFAVQADPSIGVKGLLKMDGEGAWYDGPSPQQSPFLPGGASPGGERDESPIVSTLPQEDPWPYDRFRTEPRSRHVAHGNRKTFHIDGSAAQRLMSFRQNLHMAYNSLGEAFSAMDMDGRGCVSFDHFHAHLVRLKLSRCDAEGSIRAVELFKLLDADANDLITPNDCLRAFEAAACQIQKDIKKVNDDRRFEMDALDHGYADGGAHVRFDKPACLTGDDSLRLATLRRFFELHDTTLVQGLQSFDVNKTGFLRKEAVVCGLIEGGYCVSASEAMDLFRILDLHGVGSLSLRYLEILDKGERLGAALAEHRPPSSPRGGTPGAGFIEHPQGHQVRSGIGSGGLFSDPGRLDGPRPPPRPHARLEQLREWDPDKLPSEPCTARRPLVGDQVVSKDGGRIRLPDAAGEANEWELLAGESATIIQVEEHKSTSSVEYKFRLENPRREESGFCNRSNFLYKPDIFARLYVEPTLSSKKQRHGKHRPSELPGVIIDDFVKKLAAEKARSTPAVHVKSNLGNKDAFRSPAAVGHHRKHGEQRYQGHGGVSSRQARTKNREDSRHDSLSPPGSASPRHRGEPPPAVGPEPRGSASPRRAGQGASSQPGLVGGAGAWPDEDEGEVTATVADKSLGFAVAKFPPDEPVIKTITPGEWASRANLEVGDVIVSVNGTSIQSLSKEDFMSALKVRPLKLGIRMDFAEMTMKLTSENDENDIRSSSPNSASRKAASSSRRAKRRNSGESLATFSRRPSQLSKASSQL